MFKKKSLGQHFLTAPSYVRAVADAADITPQDTILEIGPGEGVLTEELLSRGAKVVAIEKDHRLIPMLKIRFEKEIAAQRLTLLEGDALEMDPPSTIYRVVANIPYYITGALIRKYLTSPHQPDAIVFLIQKEVAQRIAKSKKESLLSLSVKVYGTPTYIKTVPRGAFSPPPEVDSAILQISNISRNSFKNKDEALFFTLIRAGFGQKRKLLARNVESVLGENTLEHLEKAGIPAKARAEDVSLEEWLRLI